MLCLFLCRVAVKKTTNDSMVGRAEESEAVMEKRKEKTIVVVKSLSSSNTVDKAEVVTVILSTVTAAEGFIPAVCERRISLPPPSTPLFVAFYTASGWQEMGTPGFPGDVIGRYSFLFLS